jgi:hypothetical protein
MDINVYPVAIFWQLTRLVSLLDICLLRFWLVGSRFGKTGDCLAVIGLVSPRAGHRSAPKFPRSAGWWVGGDVRWYSPTIVRDWPVRQMTKLIASLIFSIDFVNHSLLRHGSPINEYNNGVTGINSRKCVSNVNLL